MPVRACAEASAEASGLAKYSPVKPAVGVGGVGGVGCGVTVETGQYQAGSASLKPLLVRRTRIVPSALSR
jgi:hypothetical protein